MTKEMIERVKNRALRKEYAQGANINETLDLIEMIEKESLVVPLPDGRQLIAFYKRDPYYPGIKIEIVHNDGTQECIAWAEYDKTRDDEKKRMRMFLWDSVREEPVVSFVYDTGEFEEV